MKLKLFYLYLALWTFYTIHVSAKKFGKGKNNGKGGKRGRIKPTIAAITDGNSWPTGSTGESSESAKKGRIKSIKPKIAAITDDTSWPSGFSVYFDALPSAFNPYRRLRPGNAKDTHSCDHIRQMIPTGLNIEIDNRFYRKYTEAYGIPVIASKDVTDEAMKRACYTLRFMLAPRFDLRMAFYKMSGKVGVIGEYQQTTDMPEHSKLPNFLNYRTRGVAATPQDPLTTAGDENLRCDLIRDKYYKHEDIMCHELAHAIHLLAANLVIPGFAKRLKDVYGRAMSKGMWIFRNGQKSYAATNEQEYWAICVSFYMNAYNRNDYKFKTGFVKDRNSLKAYDPDIYKLIQEIFPCNNEYISRCAWNTAPKAKRIMKEKRRRRSECPVKATRIGSNVEDCLGKACYYSSNAFAMEGDTCIVLNCPEDSFEYVVVDPGLGWDIYQVDCPTIMEKETAQVLEMDCMKSPEKERCDQIVSGKVKASALSNGNVITDQVICTHHGGCPSGNQCYYPPQECVDKTVDCYDAVMSGACVSNKKYMLENCRMSCNICDVDIKDPVIAKGCSDKNLACGRWAESMECEKNPVFMRIMCKHSCKMC